MRFMAANIKQIGISGLVLWPRLSERRPDSVTYIDQSLLAYSSPSRNLAFGIFRYRENKGGPVTGWTNEALVIGTLRRTRIIPDAQMIEVMQCKDEWTTARYRRIISGTEKEARPFKHQRRTQ